MDKKNLKICIVGGGPAGIAAAMVCGSLLILSSLFSLGNGFSIFRKPVEGMPAVK